MAQRYFLFWTLMRITIDKLLAPHLKLAPVLVQARAHARRSPFDERRKSRLRATLDNGEEAALLLPRGTVLRGGDVLVADDGALRATWSPRPEYRAAW